MEDPNPHLLCFAEDFDGHAGTHSTSLDGAEAGSFLIDVEVQEAEDRDEDLSQHYVSVIRSGGLIQCFSQLLEKELWRTRLPPLEREDSADAVVQSMRWCPLAQAAESLLKQRPDLSAHIQSLEQHGLPKALLLAVTTTNSGKAQASLYKLTHGPRSPENVNLNVIARSIVSSGLPLPTTERVDDTTRFEIDTSSGCVIGYLGNRISIINLESFSPLITHRIPVEDLRALSVCPISRIATLAITSRDVRIIDPRYNAILDHQNFPVQGSESCVTNLVVRSQGEQARRSMPSSCLIRHFQLLIVLRNQQLYALDFRDASIARDHPRKRKRSHGLSDSLFRGSRGEHISLVGSFGDPHRAPSASVCDMSRIATTIHSEPLSKRKGNNRLQGPLVRKAQRLNKLHDVISQGVPVWASQLCNTTPFTVADYLITNMFQLCRDTTSSGITEIRLEVITLPNEIYQWLIDRALLAHYQVQSSLHRLGVLQISEYLLPNAFIDSILSWDPSLRSTFLILKSGCILKTHELLRILQIYLNLVVTRKARDHQIIEEVARRSIIDHGIRHAAKGNHAITSHREDESEMEKLYDDLFGTLVERLTRKPLTEVSQALRYDFTAEQTGHFVEALRFRLACEGWLTSYLHSAESTFLGATSAAGRAGDLLNCAMGVIGVRDWAVGSASPHKLLSVAQTLGYMKAEISAAIDGILDAQHLNQTMGHLLLYERRGHRYKRNHQHYPGPFQRNQSPQLPLGISRPTNLISLHRVGAGGMIRQRSARDMGRLKSRAVKRYSFEQVKI